MSGILNDLPSQKEAAFSFVEYRFTNAYIDFSGLHRNGDLTISFNPSGVYDDKQGLFRLSLSFVVRMEDSRTEMIKVECQALFRFREPLPIGLLPDYFFANSTAIIYPYIRAFVSTLSLQANYRPFVLPTFNVSALGAELKKATTVGTVSETID